MVKKHSFVTVLFIKKVVHKIRRWQKAKYIFAVLGIIFAGLGMLYAALYSFDYRYAEKIYPGVLVEGIDFGGQESVAITDYYLSKNIPLENLTITFTSDERIATLSGSQLDLGFDATLSAQQAYLIGRGSDSSISNLIQKIESFRGQINLLPLFRYKEGVLTSFLTEHAQFIDIPVQDALFNFENGKVTAFRPSKVGRQLNIGKTTQDLNVTFGELSAMTQLPSDVTVDFAIEPIHPAITTDQSNDLGIKDHIGHGESYFAGSISGREHNIVLAASRINGTLIPPGGLFSFNRTVGDISAATGYADAYVIKNGRTVLDDGGGVCQVSTTLFRAALDTGVPIEERWAHSYRVSYYEQGGWEPGFDATIYAPNYDLKFRNNTAAHILVLMDVNLNTKKLTFDLYGTDDGRQTYISGVTKTDYKEAPPPLYQEDPTLAPGEVKQVDWAATGVTTNFSYLVTKNGKTITSDNFRSRFVPWQSVYLEGPKI